MTLASRLTFWTGKLFFFFSKCTYPYLVYMFTDDDSDAVTSPDSLPPAASPAPLTASRARASSRRTDPTTRTSSTRTLSARATS